LEGTNVFKELISSAKDCIRNVFFGGAGMTVLLSMVFTMFAWHYGYGLAICIWSCSFLFAVAMDLVEVRLARR